MSIKTYLVDGKGNTTKTEVTYNNALKVATLDYYVYSNFIKYFSNDEYGIDMAVNGYSGGGELIHDGGDTAAWTGSNITGTSFDFASTANPYSGTYNIRAATIATGSINQVKRATNIGLISYSTISGHMYISTYNPSSVLNLYAYNTSTGTQIGSAVDVYNYVNTGVLGVYQPFTIPLTDMSLNTQTIDSFRFQTAGGANQNFDLDDITLTLAASGSPVSFTYAPEPSEVLVCEKIWMTIIDDYDGITGQNGMMKLEYNKFLGETLDNGWLMSRYVDGEIYNSFTVRNIGELLSFAGVKIEHYFSDGINTMITVSFPFFEPIVLNHINDKMVVSINDNLTGLIKFTMSVSAKKYIGETGGIEGAAFIRGSERLSDYSY